MDPCLPFRQPEFLPVTRLEMGPLLGSFLQSRNACHPQARGPLLLPHLSSRCILELEAFAELRR